MWTGPTPGASSSVRANFLGSSKPVSFCFHQSVPNRLFHWSVTKNLAKPTAIIAKNFAKLRRTENYSDL